MAEKKRKPGRPKGLRPARKNQLNIRLNEDELGKVSQAAAKDDQPVSTFAREGALEWAVRILRTN
jgi:uncharacterized protein (DUF1778 family)